MIFKVTDNKHHVSSRDLFGKFILILKAVKFLRSHVAPRNQFRRGDRKECMILEIPIEYTEE